MLCDGCAMTDNEVFAAVQALVAAGEYLDELPAAPLVRVQLPEGRRWFGRGYRRGSPQHLAARAAGGVVRLPPLTPASQDAVTQAEQLVGHRLPRLLRRLYLEVGNGGCGPGYGILGVRGGHSDEGHRNAVDLFPWSWSPSAPPAAAAVLLPVCYWGCGIYSLVDCTDRDAGMWGWDPNPVPDHDNGVALFAQGMTFAEWLARWVAGRLYQPALVEDPVTGQWRGATDQEYAAWVAELES